MPSTTPDVPPAFDAGSTGKPPAGSGGVPVARRPRPAVDDPRGVEARGARPGRRPPDGPPRRTGAPLPVAAGVAALWAAVVSYLPAALVLSLTQFADGAAGLGGAARLGLAGWLLGHGVPLTAPGGPLGLAPLTLAALAAWRVARAGVHVTRAIGARDSGSTRRALVVAGAVGVGYGVLGVLAALVAGTATVTVDPVRAGCTLAVFGAAASLVGALRTTGALWRIARRTPPPLRHGLRTGVVAGLLVLGAGAGAAGLAVTISAGDASDMIAAYRTGVAGQAGITLISMGYALNAAVWAAAYLLGPGFAVGVDTTVSATEVTLGGLPAVPVLAGLPDGPVGGVGAVLLAVPVLAGMAAGWLLGRRWLHRAARDGTPVQWAGVFSAAAVGGPVAGVVLGLAAFASGGPLGGERLAEVGPVAWQVGAAATLLVAIGTLIGAAATRAFPHLHTR